MEVGFGLRDQLPIDDPNQRAATKIEENDKTRCQPACSGWPLNTGDMKSLAKVDSCAEKADSKDHLRRQLCGSSPIGKQTGENHKTRRADRDQRIGPQAGHPLTPLAFKSDACAQGGLPIQAPRAYSTSRRSQRRISIPREKLGVFRGFW